MGKSKGLRSGKIESGQNRSKLGSPDFVDNEKRSQLKLLPLLARFSKEGNNAVEMVEIENGENNIKEESISSPCSKFPNCSGKYLSQGCNGKGKIAGGISSLPGMGWFPLKVYRPCPSL